MSCIYLTQRTKKYKPYFFCRQSKQQITLSECKNCSERKYKEIKPIKNKSNKLAKLERNRYSIITNDLDKCYICKQPKWDLHEVFGGRNRQISMKYGLVIPVCRKCHEMIPNDKTLTQKLHEVGRKAFEKEYKSENFIQIFGKSYL